MRFPTHRIIAHYLAEEQPDSNRFLANWERVFGSASGNIDRVLSNALFWIEHMPNATIGMNNLERFTDRLSDTALLLDFLNNYPSAFKILWKTLSFSSYLAEILIRNPEDFYWLIEEASLGKTIARDDLTAQFNQVIAGFESQYRQKAFIHRLHRRHFLRIGIRDLLGLSEFRETVAALSTLADALLAVVTDFVLHQKSEHEPIHSRFVVLALGKLGGNELNYSSDIDLMYVYERDGTTDQGLTYSQLFQEQAEQITTLLNEQSEHGLLYRVDTRLRPDGTSGVLCQSISAYLRYYESRGRRWERQMLIKARPVAGDVEFGTEVLTKFEPFIYPKLMKYPLTELAVHRRQTETDTPDGFNVKTDPGGIRDVEFIAQGLQLQFGGQAREIRSGNTLDSLASLAENERFITKGEYQDLTRGYVFLRRVEHALQLQHNIQIHILPHSEPEAYPLAYILGFKSYRELCSQVERTMDMHRGIFNSIFHSDADAIKTNYQNFNESQWLNLFEKQHYTNPRKAVAQIRSLSAGKFPNNFNLSTTHAFWKLCPSLLSELNRMAAPSSVLTDFERIIHSYGAPESLYTVLSEDSDLLRLVLDVINQVNKTVPWIVQQPGLLDDFMVLSSEPNDLEAFRKRLIQSLRSAKDEDAQLEPVFNTFHSLLMDVMLHWLSGHYEFPVMQKRFTLVHLLLIQSGLEVWFQDNLQDVCAIVAGSAATESMVYTSDIDLVFLLSPTADSVELNDQIEQFTQLLQSYTRQGQLLSLDFRLRPEGQSSPLVKTLDQYGHYIKSRMDAWEFQALYKARFLWGNEKIFTKFHQSLTDEMENQISQPEFWKKLLTWEKQVRMEKIKPHRDDFVYHPGGQFATRNSTEWHAIQQATSGTSPHLDDDGPTLQTGIRWFHRLRWYISANLEGSPNTLPGNSENLNKLINIMGSMGVSEFEQHFHHWLKRLSNINTSFRNELL